MNVLGWTSRGEVSMCPVPILRVFLLAVIAVLAGCAHLPPPVTAACELPAYRLVVTKSGLPPGLFAQESVQAQQFRSMVNSELLAARRVQPNGGEVLILSGGSQHGAFGAGFFAGMGQRPGGVPDYTFVTGVSAGALVSTLVFLANKPIESGRKYPPYMKGVGVSNLEDLAAIFSVDKEDEILDVKPFGAASGIVDGSLATFAPLRSLIFGMLSDATLEDIQAAYHLHRHLLVGVTNLRDGNGYAIDLTQYVNDALNRGIGRNTIRNCYIDALLASSSVPPGMPPISLALYNPLLGGPAKPDMYIDGGARFGVFWGQLDYGDLPNLRNATVLINGTYAVGPWDDFQKKGTWSLISVARRSSDILIDQVYKFSVDQIEHEFPPPMQLREAYISNVGLGHYGPDAAVDPDEFQYKEGGTVSTCGGWRTYDDQRYSPLEFHPNYMQCLVQYGRMRGSSAPWNRVSP